jgi:signal transduction histidine kinase
VAGEGLWSKAEKDAIYQLRRYSDTHDENDYRQFLNFMAVPMGDHKARVELFRPHPDLSVVRQGFLEGRNHEDDIDGMIKLVMRFHNISYIQEAIRLWSAGDTALADFFPLGQTLHNEINSPKMSQSRIDEIVAGIDPINKKITELEDGFSFTLGAGSRWLENLVLKLLFGVALTVEVTGLLLTYTVSRRINKGLHEIIRSTDKIRQGHLNDRAQVMSGDEIGRVAESINSMAGQLIRSNKELGQFAYIASHDLQEPLRTITNFSKLLNEDYGGRLDEKADKYLQYISLAATRMQNQIHDLLEYSRIGADIEKVEMDSEEVVREVVDDLHAAIEASGATIEVGDLPRVPVSTEFKLLLQNLLSNAIKYRKPDEALHISIRAEDAGNEWDFAIADNGIGIAAEYCERIFVIFQKLHSRREYEGTGIGLAQCKKIVELNGGRIWVESEPGKGSTFHFTLPKIIHG